MALPIVLLVYEPLYERLGMPLNVKNIAFAAISVTTLIMGFIFILAGIIVYIKFRRE